MDIAAGQKIKKNSRIVWVDICKLIGIFLMVVGHSTKNENILSWIYSFHMPLFFILSGYTYDITKYKNRYTYVNYLKNNVKHLVFPIIIFGFITTLYRFVWNYIFMDVNRIDYKIIQNGIIGIFLQLRLTKFGGYFWFLSALFVSKVILYKLVEKVDSTKAIFALSVSCFVTGSILKGCLNIGGLLWNLDVVPFIIGFLLIGILIRRFEQKGNVGWFIIILICYVISFKMNCTVDMCRDIYGDYFLYVLESITGSVIMMQIVKLACRKVKIPITQRLAWLGSNSLIIYCMNEMTLWFSSALLHKVGIQINNIFITTILIPVVAILITIPIIILYNTLTKHLIIVKNKALKQLHL